MASSYGVAGSFVIQLVLIYYSTQIFFFGAKVTQVYANRTGSVVRQSARAPERTSSNRRCA